MSARVVLIGVLAFLGFAFFAIILGTYIYYKRVDKNGKQFGMKQSMSRQILLK
ncbi:hypothetical protein [Bulleidia sp. zg-1006]|uniref:hypothetical protein n=1 Tax=Bulleidia sp. zg-1006 TaxID=2806552 RepID=UPI0019399705|nr:hypothetical protein [Bulleidia sp. zg-1006]QRG86484.1 hypothetical protein JOS54_06445 [Bulleidia sp. zg-1006]